MIIFYFIHGTDLSYDYLEIAVITKVIFYMLLICNGSAPKTKQMKNENTTTAYVVPNKFQKRIPSRSIWISRHFHHCVTETEVPKL